MTALNTLMSIAHTLSLLLANASLMEWTRMMLVSGLDLEGGSRFGIFGKVRV